MVAPSAHSVMAMLKMEAFLSLIQLAARDVEDVSIKYECVIEKKAG